ncbi:GT4 family glycosyltransferase PelF [Alicyclobacillus cycloheptanicus]|uniref:Glycosyltransferase involved in cell wall biosynthesis/predicted negative regulator of RcsB-dependent stress response n=1 Tax=Alicyclobacillus cycloheptanicus TaxID=1457 RepID=A0ABT9XIK9_9BACL|nr:GT4 family glycosyltransferase PelF [Alicyclobacillus cycloheptanicus]MDQ0190123.1 glycosyltransferase involved in cell wall biosynthesis/predicted negative regulator of RcsB-dependent stress response [Alicyclobacillus cycloheptanicus]WDM02095.1 GT4 family glycosyltransferase PelF [Alicyclobacillus cycloheptanicus]
MARGIGETGKISVLLTTEGTYPFSPGGVSTWCDIMVHRLKSVDYTVFSVQMDPFVAQQYQLPKGTALVKVPLWGTEEPSEHLDQRFSTTYLSKQRTTDAVIEDQFLPLFVRLVQHIIAVRKDPFAFANLIVELYDFFTDYDYKVSFKSPRVWEAYKRLIQEAVKNPELGMPQPDIYSLIQSLGWVYRFFNIINTPVPRTTVTHASAAAFCGLPCVIAKLKYGTPFLLTEHGVYLREQYLSLSKRGYPGFLNTFLIRLIHAVVDLNYALADQISPVCHYNTRWERVMTDRHERIEVIYNGVDHEIFTRARALEHPRPTVVAVARIDPIKDILGLIRAADLVRREIPDVQFLVYGAVSVPDYHKACERLVKELKLENTVVFCGQTSDIAAAYEQGDVAVLSSISEAFPYSIVEAMLAGKAIVSTDVGGVSEALGDTGILVPPGEPQALADGLIRLLNNPGLRSEMGQNARDRALNLFTLERSLEMYLKAYVKLSVAQPHTPLQPVARFQVNLTDLRRQREEAGAAESAPSAAEPVAGGGRRQGALDAQRMYMERAYALLDAGFRHEALEQMVLAVEAAPHSPATPVLLADLARLRVEQQDFETAHSILETSIRQHQTLLRRRQQLLAERALALADFGKLPEAAALLRRAVAIAEDSPAVPVFCLELSRMYAALGERERARLERLKYEWVAGGEYGVQSLE